MLVPVFVIAHGALLGNQHRIFQRDDALTLRRRKQQLHRIDGFPDIAAAGLCDPRYHALLSSKRFRTSAVENVKCPLYGNLSIFRRHRFELKHRRPAQNRPEHAEIRVLGSRSNQCDAPILNKLQQTLLLLFVKVLNLIQVKQHPAGGQQRIQFLNDALDVGNPCGCGVELSQASLRTLGNDAGNRSFPGSRRPVEDHIGGCATFYNPPQKAVLTQNMLLPDNIVQAVRANFIGKRLVCFVHN